MRRTVLIDAPSNLGLRPPAPGTVPGCYKLAGALREQGLLRRLGALEGGVVVPPRYDLGEWKEGDGDFNAAALAAYTSRLATRVEGHVGSGDFPVVLGGDCSILLGAVLALRRLGRYGVAYLDGHGDFRHPGNVAVSGPVGAAAGEGVAQITGRGQADLTDLDGLRPYVRDEDVCVLGIRDADEDQEELTGLGISHAPVGEIRRRGPETVAREVLTHFQRSPLDGFWIHLDADVLDPSVMPAVDSPDPGGLLTDELRALLGPLAASPRCAGINVTIYDPDRDPEGTGAVLLADLLESVFAQP
ncbi:arginase family protein [Streptomyces sp. Je 1-4]|uniref:arginase family protein n=1 Tax=Streptomyces TaxID=1883 RepID=UPI0021DA77B4|nr:MULTISPECIES: arginase family protein [unclassified Streptomyces]UYB38966.1 arginase family protein [Streptomyces sp. Je 1-4]UZQ34961.1 arginase family protein [Streptomyces sp. Je 1-4] [Streptomyces sp. Je 1-4 4N24]UZQ42379.1 arginase family protein [Streptomyces sp. Je 1-4] [Streptomyces sp. Je 1-4 4N24_ara]